jgi:hypothetical protein
MAETFRIPNFSDLNVRASTQLTADALSAQDKVVVVNPGDFAHSDFVILGNDAGDNRELLVVDTVTSSTQTIKFTTNLTTNHKKFEKLTKLFGDQIKLYRAPNVTGLIPLDTAFALVGTPFDIDAAEALTMVTDSGGGSGFWYKFTYFNSLSSAETDLSLSSATRGGNWGHYCSIEDIRKESGMKDSPQVLDTQIAARREQAESEINGTLLACGYTLPLQMSNNQPFTPPLIQNVARLLSAGYVLIQDYGPISPASTKNGDQKVTQARDLLDKIQNRKVLLVDPNGNRLAVTERIKFWPDDSTAQVGTDGVTPEPRLFTIAKKF